MLKDKKIQRYTKSRREKWLGINQTGGGGEEI